MPNISKYKSISELEEAIANKWGNDYELVNKESIKSLALHSKVYVKCNKCGNISEKEINTVLKFGCKYCCNGDIRNFRTNAELKKYVSDITDGEYSLLSDHSKTREYGTFRHNLETCKNPDKTFSMKIHGFITLGHRCPYCNQVSIGTSLTKGNLIIKKYLDSKNIKYEQEYAFSNCRSKNANRLLYFDFYIPSLKMVIEFDGEQHIRPIDYFGGETAFKILQEHDTIKNEYCIAHDIILIRINTGKYTSEKKIKNILNSYFKS